MKTIIFLLAAFLATRLHGQTGQDYRPETWAYLLEQSRNLKVTPTQTGNWRSMQQADVVLVHVPAEQQKDAAGLAIKEPTLDQFIAAFPQAELDTVRAAMFREIGAGKVDVIYTAISKTWKPLIALPMDEEWPRKGHRAGKFVIRYWPQYNDLSLQYHLSTLASIPFADKYQLEIEELRAATGGLTTAYLPDAVPAHVSMELGDLAAMSLEDKQALLRSHRMANFPGTCDHGGQRGHLRTIGVLAAECHEFPLWLLVQLQLLVGNLDREARSYTDLELAQPTLKDMMALGLPIRKWLLTMALQSDHQGPWRLQMDPFYMAGLLKVAAPKELPVLKQWMLDRVADPLLDPDNRQAFYRGYHAHFVKQSRNGNEDKKELAKLNAAAGNLRLND